MRFAFVFVLAACGAHPASPDAQVCTTMTCGSACCTAASACIAGTCTCPSNFVPAMPMFVTGVVVKNLPQIPGLLAAIGQFDQPAERDALLVAYDPATAQAGIEIDLATSTDVKIGFGYDIDPNQNIRGSFRAMTGTVHFTSVCAAGVSGTLTNAALEEIDIFTDLTPIAGGCAMSLPSVTFAIAGACPVTKTSDEPELRSPIPFRTGSNGEFMPRAPSALDRRAEEAYRRVVDDNARKRGISRRDFIDSACGTAAALLVINSVYGCGDNYKVDSDAAIDPDGACHALAGDEFIFDVQTHHVDPAGSWRHGSWELAFDTFPEAACGEADKMVCYDRQHYIREMFINSDTDIAVLSAVPAQDALQPLNRQETTETKHIIDALQGSPRLLVHGLVLPQNGEAELDGMQDLMETMQIAAWKSYTQFGGWRFTDPAGIAFVEKALALDTDIICTHKGLTLFGLDPAFASAADIGPAAKMFPAMRFVVYHSGFEIDHVEGPYDPTATVGIDTLIKTMLDNDLGAASNVYAEIGSTWRNVMTSPTQAQHVIGKLLTYFGEDRLLWGTDSIWYGSPQDQIDAFRTFQISTEFQDRYGYPALTDAIKAKIFGLSAAALYHIDPAATRCAISNDQLAVAKRDRDRPALRLRDYGPRSRREFLAFMRQRDGQPG